MHQLMVVHPDNKYDSEQLGLLLKTPAFAGVLSSSLRRKQWTNPYSDKANRPRQRLVKTLGSFELGKVANFVEYLDLNPT